jgi:hypothetical protein
MKKLLPDFELADLQTLPSNFLETDDVEKKSVGAFILTLSLIFNDLKTFSWLNEQIIAGDSGIQELTAYNGQRSGFNLHMRRMIIGCLWEFLKAIKCNQDVLKHPEFLACLSKQTENVKKIWKTIVEHATEVEQKEPPKKTLGYLLFAIRNATSFHYSYTGHLYNGYEKWRQGTQPHNQKAYVSLGNSMMKTRFYFADAASDAYLEGVFKEQDISIKELFDFVREVNVSVRFIVEAYIQDYIEKVPITTDQAQHKENV